MNRLKNSFSFLPTELENIKRRMLHWANRSNILLFLDSNEYRHTQGLYECLCASEVYWQISEDDGALSQLKAHYKQHQDWLFGHISYDFKNKLEQLSTDKEFNFSFPDIHFFCPETVLYIKRNESCVWIESITQSPDDIWQEIVTTDCNEEPISTSKIRFQKRIEQKEYCHIINQLQQHIIDGDCYEINFCNEAFCKDADINPLSAFDQLNKSSKAPFAAYYKLNNQYMLCASPERFLCKKEHTITAQPIKGTSRRGKNEEEDELQKIYLQHNIKERAENVMIVDLMRNDLARFCKIGSVQVDELFGIYSFPQVHQMISTISGELSNEMDLFDALRLAFPMGSMTGAPKIMVMQLIERYEQARRALFSGSVGYINPEGDFDFNVVIRSLFYNSESHYLSYQTGGAITADSHPEQEWEETCLKASALENIFQ